MPFSLLPKLVTQSVTDLTPEYLTGRGIRLLMLDFDNTIVPYTTSEADPQMDAWLKTMLASPVQICVVSNSKRPRVRVFCEKYGIPCITHSKKPFPKGIRQCLDRFQMDPGQCALAGDQIFTDNLGANCCGVTSILIKPINNHNIWLKARHVLEKPFIFAARKRRIPYEKH